ncbi:MAG: Sec-independent protein translocase protein TatB [Acidihalobacter sp.]|jgi:sec-independent protein translocase protein TatB|uniref:Sec-independent protein translocase protein TatB n=1 Tax=Acidihalobacter sp. TaxID=1872108 RepID=UPI00307E8148
MFDLGFSEIMLIMIVALVVVGPERLPGLARKAGYWVGRFRRYVVNVRSEIERELNADELRSMLTRQEDEIRELRDMLQDTRSQIHNEVDDIAQEVDSAGEQLRHSLDLDNASRDTPIPAEEHALEAPTEEHASTAPEPPLQAGEQTTESIPVSGQADTSPPSEASDGAAMDSEKSAKS